MEVNKVGEITVVTILTRVDANSAKAVETKMSELLSGGTKKIVCNFSQNEYISSAGLRVFLSVLKTMRKSGGSIALCSLRPQVSEVFDMAGFIPLFTICDTADEAIQQLS
ncbi:STAS domain-containing protein [Sporomusa malonica]|uniref:Anti-sigma factor antagonist n=1 Tax=Sporomusa malonica TaxID=112901 RepID=A0A1W2E899_9FIRM|nr:STAS domain-containing protein [Sporomusa malonica]SMD05288.1 anti-sigma B factor antagonist [Sporomusa malonica]